MQMLATLKDYQSSMKLLESSQESKFLRAVKNHKFSVFFMGNMHAPTAFYPIARFRSRNLFSPIRLQVLEPNPLLYLSEVSMIKRTSS